MNILELLNQFVDYKLVDKDANPGTIRNYKSYIEKFVKLTGATLVEHINEENISIFKKKLVEEGLSHKTINYYLFGMRTFIKYLERKRMIVMNPFDIELYDRIKDKDVKLLTKEQLTLFLEYRLDDKSDLLANILFGTGLRIFELHGLQAEDINKEKRSILITGKGNKKRLVYVMKKQFDMLQDFLVKNKITKGALFLNRFGEPMSLRHLQRLIDTRREKLLPAGFKLSPHTLRHQYATTLLENGMSVAVVQKLLGHASLTTTQKYLHVSDKAMKDEFEKVVNSAF